jgi:multidrug resistance efflux pump
MKKIRTPWRQVFEDFRQGWVPLLVWMGAAVGALWLMRNQVDRFEYVGLAQGLQFEVSAPEDGRLQALLVDVYEDVEPEQIVAQLDDSLIEARIETARVAVEGLQAQLDAQRAELAQTADERLSQWQADLVRFQTAEERHRLAALGLRVEIESDRFEQQRLALEMERARRLVDEDAGAGADFDSFRLQHDQVAQRIDQNQVLLAETELAWRQARDRREQFLARSPETPAEEDFIQPFRQAVRQQESLLRELQIERRGTLLRAPVTGRITQILCQVGQAVVPGEPIVLISERYASQVVGYMSETDADRISEQMTVEVARAGQPDRVAEAIVTRVGPAVEQMPIRLWSTPTQPSFGRPFTVTISSPLSLIPGEKLLIRLAAAEPVR